MKTLTLTLALSGAVALAVPALADTASTTTTPSASQQCRAERAQMGASTFAQTYGTNRNRSNAFGKCVSRRRHATAEATRQARKSAAADCRAERDADRKAFDAKYGTGKHGRNAFGKCVSAKSREKAAQKVDEQVNADVSAAKDCRAERDADRKAFEQKYGTNHNKRNAFGKCVSAKAKARQSS